MDISNQCRPGWGYPNFQKLNHGYLQQVRTSIGISQTSKIKSWISLICAEQIWYIPKTEKIYLWSAAIVWFIHGIACDNQRYPWYISKHWYIPGISLVYAKTRKLINGYQIPDVSRPAQVGASMIRVNVHVLVLHQAESASAGIADSLQALATYIDRVQVSNRASQ